MPNPITGDFEAVLQVSGSTIDRLLASMHQQFGTPTSLPVFPHDTFILLGDDGGASGVRGIARIQLSPPRIELLHMAQDRFVIRVWVRAHFTPDSGSAAFPTFIYGEVRAEYRIREEHHQRYGVVIASYVDPSGVTFNSAGPDKSWDSAITAQVVHALTVKYVMTPHPLKADFQERRLRSLREPGGISAVTVPLALSTPNPAGGLASLNAVVLGGRDLAVAISREYIMSLVQPTLDSLLASQMKVSVHINTPWPLPDISTIYHVVIERAIATWAPGVVPVLNVPGGRISLDIGGRATTPNIILPDASFTVKHDLWLIFNAPTETFTLYHNGTPWVSASVSGLFGGIAKSIVENKLASQFVGYANSAVAKAGPQLQNTATRKKVLVDQLQSMDGGADAHFTGAEFTPDVAILKGTITVSPRAWMKVNLGKLSDASGFTAYPSWIPGGRITEFHWSWFWFTTSPTSPTTGPFGQAHDDRFLLQSNQSLPGLPPVPGTPLPPWGSAGAMCLTIHGMVTDVVTGAEVPVTSAGMLFRMKPCLYFYPPSSIPGILIPAAKLRVYARAFAMTKDAANSRSGGSKELAVIDIGKVIPGKASPVNSLIQYYDTVPSEDSVAALAEALGKVRRPGAGLVIVALMRDGLLGADDGTIAARLERLVKDAPGPVLIADDVDRSWSSRLELPVGRGTEYATEATRLVTPDGRLAWQSDGPADTEALVRALSDNLAPAPPPIFQTVDVGVAVDHPAPDFFLEGSRRLRLTKLQGQPVVVSFVQPWAVSSTAHARRLERTGRRWEEMGGRIVLVIDGADQQAADEFVRANCPSAWGVGDSAGAITDRYGVRIWPTTLLVDDWGKVAAVEIGTDPGALDMLGRE